jgi:hypothetical protein
MRLTRTPSRPFVVPAWRVDAAQLLEEHHLVAWSPVVSQREAFASELAAHLARFEDTQVCVINGAAVTDLQSLADALSAALGVGRVAPRLGGPSGLLDCLRRRSGTHDRPALKRRFYIWRDADMMLRRDHQLFGRIVDCLAGIAAESEYTSEDVLLLQRAVFVGSSMLDVYAEDPRGQFRRWWSEHDERPFWDVVTGVERPVFLRYRIEEAVAA